MNLSRLDIVCLLIALVVSAVVYGSVTSKNPFGYDEADYMYASSKGLFAHYVDQNAIPLFQFLRVGFGEGLDKQNRTSLSETVRAADDIAFFRHYHGPLLLYSLIIWQKFVNGSEYSIRWVCLLYSLLTIVALYVACFHLVTEKSRLMAFMASMLFITAPVNMVTPGSQLSTHTIYGLLVTASLCLMARLIQSRELKYWYYSVAVVALSFMATEFAPLLAVTLLVCAAIERRHLFAEWGSREYLRLAFISAAIFVGVIFVLWPGAWLKLTLIRNYMVMAYLALARVGAFGSVDFAQGWLDRLTNAPVHYLVFLFAISAALVQLKRSRWYLPLLIYPILFFLATIKITAADERYISSIFPPLCILTAAVLVQHFRRFAATTQAVGVTVLSCMLVAQGYFHFVSLREQQHQSTALGDVVAFFRTTCPDCNTLIVERRFLPTLQYYFPDKELTSYSGESDAIAAIVEEVKTTPSGGIVYDGTQHAVLEKQLKARFHVAPQTIRKVDEDRRIVFFKLFPREGSPASQTNKAKSVGWMGAGL